MLSVGLLYSTLVVSSPALLFFFNATATPEIYTLSLHDALPISRWRALGAARRCRSSWRRRSRSSAATARRSSTRSEEHTSELQSRFDLVCRLLLEKKKTNARHALKLQSRMAHVLRVTGQSPIAA